MTRSHLAIRPRPNQIAELTRGLRLPLPEIEEEYLKIIAESLYKAFYNLKSRYPAILAEEEDEITAFLETELNNMVSEDEIWRTLVSNVTRGRECLSFDGSHLKKEPDLSIYLTGLLPNFPLVVEAKLIDVATSKTETLYCDNGIMRFVKGEYAWGNREAFMIAYVRDNSSISTKLAPFLDAKMNQSPPGYSVTSQVEKKGDGTIDLAMSQHGRRFNYIGRSPPEDQPGAISVWHLWLV